MGTFVEYKPQQLPLPEIGEGFEHATLDLKRRADTQKTFHLAKDVAAFANHLGGTIIIGAEEGTNGSVGAYIPLTDSELKQTQDAFSKAVTQRCSPRPVIDFGHYKEGSGHILTVLVWPYIGQPIGVKVHADKSNGGYGGDDAYAFPVRSGADSLFLLPEQLPMYMLPELRKLVITLSQAKHDSPVMLHTFATVARAPTQTSFLSVCVLSNTLTVLAPHKADSKKNPSEALIPLDAITAAWKTPKGIHVLLNGGLSDKNEFLWRQRTS